MLALVGLLNAGTRDAFLPTMRALKQLSGKPTASLCPSTDPSFLGAPHCRPGTANLFILFLHCFYLSVIIVHGNTLDIAHGMTSQHPILRLPSTSQHLKDLAPLEQS